MAQPDGVTLKKCAHEYGQRAERIGKEKRSTADLQNAMDHPNFKQRHHELLDMLAREHEQSRLLIDPPFVTVEVGGYGGGDELVQVLRASGCLVTEYAESLLLGSSFPVCSNKETIELGVSTSRTITSLGTCHQMHEVFEALSGLGGKMWPPREEGARLLPAETAAQLCLQYSGKPLLGGCLLYSEPVRGYVFEVKHVRQGGELKPILHARRYDSPFGVVDGHQAWLYGRH